MIDFIKEIFFFDYPGLSLAVDPISLITILGPQLAKFIGGRAANKAAQVDKSRVKSQFDKLGKDLPQFSVGSAFKEYLNLARQDPAADLQRQIAAEQEASNIGALKSGGAKALLGGLGAVNRQAAQTRMGIEASSQKRLQDALAAFGAQEQAVQDKNVALQQQLTAAEFQALRGADARNRALKAQRIAGIADLAGGLLGSAGDIAEAFKTAGAPQLTGADFRAEPGIQIDPNQINPNPVMSDDMLNMGTQVTGLPTPTFGSGSGGGMYGLKRGGMMTPGEFSHKSNPIDIMQDGAKIGEMTGGEAVLNPEQQKKTAKESPYFRKLMREFAMRERNER
tara:strand:+ start:2036 stop:3046 length:1011 start_codon:yes stop_codon:yes gene_type:complete